MKTRNIDKEIRTIRRNIETLSNAKSGFYQGQAVSNLLSRYRRTLKKLLLLKGKNNDKETEQ